MGIKNLTLIPDTSLHYSVYCVECATQITRQLKIGNYPCYQSIINSLDSLILKVSNFYKTDSIILQFRTFRCVEEDDDWLNKQKMFNSWAFELSNSKGICKNNYSSITKIPSTIRSGIDNTITASIDPFLKFIPSVTDLSVASGQVLGDSALFDIDMNGLNKPGFYPDWPIFGVTMADTTNPLNGYLRVSIACQKGIRIPSVDANVFFSYFDYNGIKNIVTPDFYYTTIPNNVCDTGDYVYYFNLQNNNFRKIFKEGKLMFQLQACCNGNAGARQYTVRFDLLTNASGLCNNLDFSDTTHSVPPICTMSNGTGTGIGCTWLPLTKVEGGITPHCPGCITPGIVIKNYTMKRTSLGLQDSNNNGIADDGLIPIGSDPIWLQNHQTEIKTNSSQFGDKVEDYLSAYFSQGEPIDGYTYGQMLVDSVQLPYVQLSRQIPSGLDIMELIPDSIYIYIDAPGSTTVDSCVDCALFGISNGKYVSQSVYHLNSSALLSSFLQMDQSSNSYLITMESRKVGNLFVGNLHSVAPYWSNSNIPVGMFYETQQYRLRFFYSTCGNFTTDEIPSDITQNDICKKSEIKNWMWLTGSPKPWNANSLYNKNPQTRKDADSSGYHVFPLDSIQHSPIDSNFANAFIFNCENFDGVHYFYSEDHKNNSLIVDGYSGCASLIDVEAEIRTAGNLFDIYPFEYKPASYKFDKYVLNIPPNYKAVKAKSFSRINEGLIGAEKVLSLVGDRGRVEILDSDFNLDLCQNESDDQTENLIYHYGDRTTSRRIYVEIVPDSCSNSTFVDNDSLVRVVFDSHQLGCLPLEGCPASKIDSVKKDIQLYATNHLPINISVNPHDSLACQNVVMGDQPTVCFSMELSNKKISEANDAPYYFIAIKPNQPALNYLNNWRIYNSTLGTYSPRLGNIFYIDSLLKLDEFHSLSFCSDFYSCPDSTIDTLEVEIYYGWSCDTFPTNLDSLGLICGLDSAVLKVVPGGITTLVEGAISGSQTFSLCDTFSVETYYQVTGGVALPHSFTISNVPNGLQVAGVEIASSTSNFVQIQGSFGNLVFPITTSSLVAIGLDSALSINQQLHIKINFIATCSFVKSTFGLPDWSLFATNYCGDTLKYSAGNRLMSFTWDGRSFCDSCITVTKTASSNYVSTFEPVTFTIHIETNNQNPSVVNVYEYLPAGFQLTSAFPTFNPLAGIFVGHQPMSGQGQANITVTGYYLNPGGCSLTNNHVAVVLPPTNKTVTADACLTVYHPCADTTATIIADSTFSSSLDSTSYQSRKFFIDGTLYVDNPLTLTNCSVHVAPGGAIMVIRDASLILNNSTIVGCDTMWQGIILDTIAHFEATNSSKIQDAQYGVTAGKKSNVTLQDADFQNNVVGLYFPSLMSGTYMGKLIVNGTNFGSFGSFKPDYQNQPSHGAFPFAGIEINDAVNATQIGVVGGNQNHFERLNSGIVCRRSIVKVSNSNFENIKEDAAYVNPSFKIHFGDAIHGEGDFLSKRPNFLTVNDNLGPITYHNCEKGIFTYYSDLIANYNTMTDMRTGIESTVCADLLRTVVRDNSIAASNYGIYWHGNAGSRIMSAQNNTIDIGTKGIGIELIEKSKVDSSNYVICPTNNITMNNAREGIHAQNVLQPLIALNNIAVSSNTVLYGKAIGISVDGCERAGVIENNIIGNSPGDTFTIGISSTISNNGKFICNSTDHTGFGFFFGGVNARTAFKGNSIYDHFDGLRLNNVAVIDSQAHGGNMWLNTMPYGSGFGAVNMNYLGGNVVKSLFTVDPNSSLSNLTTSIPIGNPPPYFIEDDGWFKPDPSPVIPTFECSSSSPSDLILGDNLGSDQLREAIAQELNLTNEYIEESKSIAKEYLVQYLNEHSSYLTDPVYALFFDLNEAQVRLNETSRKIAEMRKIEETTGVSLVANYTLIETLADSLSELSDLNAVQPILNYQAIAAQLESMIENVKMLNNNLLQQTSILTQANYNQAEIANGGVYTTEIPQINSQFINEVSLQYEQLGIAAIESYYPSLEVLANQCPYQGGNAVYRARYFVGLLNDSIEFNDDLNCLAAGIWRTANDSNNSGLNFNVIPNPSVGNFNISFNKSIKDAIEISVVDGSGRNVSYSKINIEGTELELNYNKLANGIYQIRIKGNEIGVLNSRITILK